MELWIRSQDKTNLILAKDIVVSGGDIKIYKDTELCTTVAMYKTKERALEVLDEIQKIFLNGLQANNNNQICGTTTYVYEMPKD